MVEIREVKTQRDLKLFVNFPDKLYKDNPYYVPTLKMDEMNVLRRDKNPAFTFCEAAYYLAYRDGEIVGSVRYEMITNDVAYLTRFSVDPNVHNSGIGKLLLAAVNEYAARQGAKAVALHTASKMTPLVRMYYGMGYYIKSTSEDRGYIRALFLKELTEDDALPDLSVLANH